MLNTENIFDTLKNDFCFTNIIILIAILFSETCYDNNI